MKGKNMIIRSYSYNKNIARIILSTDLLQLNQAQFIQTVLKWLFIQERGLNLK